MYPGIEKELSEVAVLTDGRNAYVMAIDGVRVLGRSSAILPGSHEVHVRFRIHTNAPNVRWTIWSYCDFNLAAAADEAYRVRVRFRKEVESGLKERVSIELAIIDERDALIATPSRCSGKRPSFTG